MFRLVLQAHISECKIQIINRIETRRFGQKIHAADLSG